MLDKQRRTIKIFIKNPEKGRVKTRLAATLGEAQALSVYKSLLTYTRTVISKIDAEKEVWYSDFVDYKDEWDSNIFYRKKQQGDNLGERMKYAFKSSFEEDTCQSVVLIGSDCAELTELIVEDAFKKLRNHDLVLGPAEDGGYYLIGMSKFIPDVFNGIMWSTHQVLDATIIRAREFGLRFSLLPLLNDVDTFEDWERVKKKLTDYD